MNFKVKNIALIAALAAACMSVSCKKDDSTTTLPYLDGYLQFDAPSYVLPGDVQTFIPSGASHPEDGDYGYYWATTPKTSLLLASNDTTKTLADNPDKYDGRLILTIPDTLCTFTLKCVMFATGYTSSSATKDICIVKDESITNIPHPEGEKSVTDARDGKIYTYVTAGGLDWMSKNLMYADAGKPYENCSPMTDLFGNLYTYEQAENACPEGWRLPTLDEWKSLCGGSFDAAAGKLMVDAYFNGNKMWEYWPAVKVTNSTGMNVMPTGYALIQSNKWEYSGTNLYSVFWTSSEYDEEQKYYVSLYVDQPDVFYGNTHKDNFAASVRCVRKATE